VLRKFDAGQSESREDRWIATGNVLAAFDKLKAGQVISFQDDKGDIRTGILLPKTADVRALLGEMDVSLPTEENIKAFLAATGDRAGVKTADKLMVITRSKIPGEMNISVPAARSKGGQYFLNRDVLAAAGKDFVKSGNFMSMRVSDAKAFAIMAALRKQGTGFIAGSHLEEARQVMGINTREAQAGANQGGRGQGPLYSLKKKGDAVGKNPATGAYDAEYDEPDHVRDLRWSINNHDRTDLDAGDFKVVPAKEMPDVALARAVERIAKAAGKKVTYLEPAHDGADLFHGVTMAEHPDQVYINTKTDKPHMFVLGHEISHLLEHDHPELFADLLAVARKEMVGLGKYRAQLNALAKSQGARGYTKESAAKELLGDFFGDSMHLKSFWQALHDIAPKSFRKIAHYVRQFLDKILVRNPYEPKSYQYFRDIVKVRKAVTEALNEAYGPTAERVQRESTRKFQEVARAYFRRTEAPKYSRKDPAPHDSDTIAWEPKKKSAREWFAKLKSDAYQQFVDEAAPAIHAAERISPEIGQAMREEFSRKRGSAGPFELLIGKDKRSKGLVTWWQEDATQKVEGSKNLAEVFAPIKDEEHCRDWTRMVFAERDLALAAFRPEVKLEEYRAQRNHLRSLLAIAETREEKRIVRSALKDAKLMYERGVSGVDADAARAELARLEAADF